MTYTLGDFDWEKVGDEFGFGYEIEYANPFDKYATVENPMEDDLDDYQLTSLEQDYEFEIYKEPENPSEEIEKLLSDMRFSGSDSAKAAAHEIKKLGVKPIKTVTKSLVFINGLYGEEILSVSTTDGMSLEISGDTGSSSGGYNEDAIYSDGRKISIDSIAKENGGDIAIPLQEFESASFSFEDNVSIEEIIDAGCLKERE